MSNLQLLLMLLALFLGFLSSCSAIHEDQAGMWDWNQQYIGKATHAAFQTLGSGRKRVVVATEKSVVSCLNLRTGEIFWRQTLEESEPIDGLEVAQGKYAVSLSRHGYLRSWNLPDGALVWETLLKASSAPSRLFTPFDPSIEKLFDLVILKGGVAYAVSSSNGRIIWKADFQDEKLSEMDLGFEGNSLYAAGLSGSSLKLFRIDPATGAVTELESNEAPASSGFVLTGGLLAALDSSAEAIHTAELNTGTSTISFQKASLSSLLPQETTQTRAKLLPTKLHGACVLSRAGSLYVLGLGNPELSVVQKVPEPAAVSDDIPLGDGGFVYSVLHHPRSGELAIDIVSGSEFLEAGGSEGIRVEAGRGGVWRVFLNAYTRTDRTRGFRALVVGEDDSLSLLQQGKVVWAREEALASIEDVYMSELPLEKSGGSVAEVEHDLAEWLKGHMLRLKSTLMLANSEELAALQSLRLNSVEKTKMVRDRNGFRKLIVAITTSGKLFALHSGDGRVVWSLNLPGFKRGGELKLFPWKIPHRHSLDESPVALVLGSSPSGNGRLFFVDVHARELLRSLELPYSIKQVLPLPLIDSLEQRLHLLVDEEDKAHLYPVSDESLEMFAGYSQNVFFYETRRDAGVIEGFRLGSRVDSSDELGHVYESHKLWSVVFPRETEVIAGTATRKTDEAVHTQAKVLGNRDVLYKYLNKNVIFVATVTPQDSRGGKPAETWLVAYLIDSVTGQVLHRVSHADGLGPVHAVFSENWVVYYYFNVRSQRHEMSVLEVYDKSSDGKDVLQIMLGRYNASMPFSSFSPRTLDIKGQSYSFSSTVKTMTVTHTGKGITGKQVLVGTLGNQVIALDKRFFDPRRTLAPTPSEREEGMIPLSEGLPVFPQSYLTHATRVEGLKGIISVPARLESTCLVFAHGIDLFFTRTAPSRTYDSLTEDFSYALLLITIVALLVAIGVTMVLSERKELREKWR